MKTIEKWIGHHFSTGSSIGEDYAQFQREAISDLRKMCKGAFTVAANKNHYEFSAVLEHVNSGKFVYVSIPDVRFFQDQWYNHVLIRTMAHPQDWTGGPNNYCWWEDIRKTALKLIGESSSRRIAGY